MNDKIRNALEVLKQAVLEVLYEKHVSGGALSSKFQPEIREHLGIPRPHACNDQLIHGILIRLRDDGLATYIDDAPDTQEDKWQITEKGVSSIEGS